VKVDRYQSTYYYHYTLHCHHSLAVPRGLSPQLTDRTMLRLLSSSYLVLQSDARAARSATIHNVYPTGRGGCIRTHPSLRDTQYTRRVHLAGSATTLGNLHWRRSSIHFSCGRLPVRHTLYTYAVSWGAGEVYPPCTIRTGVSYLTGRCQRSHAERTQTR
jgi:hypothetical protein